MPKGQIRSEDDRLDELAIKIKQLQQRKDDLAKTKADKAKRLMLRRSMLIGETILDAKLSHEEKAIICRVIARRTDKPADWDKISDFAIHTVTPTSETHKVTAVISEFARTGK